MSSGVTVHPQCVPTFNDLKIGHKYRYIVYSLTDDLKQIHVLKTAPPSATYDDFVEDLREAEQQKQGRYGVYDAEYKLKDGQSRQKIVFFLWSPDTAQIKQKMLYTSSKEYIRKALVGIGKEVQACDYEELEWSNVLDTLLRTETAGS
jgi:cofilin